MSPFFAPIYASIGVDWWEFHHSAFHTFRHLSLSFFCVCLALEGGPLFSVTIAVFFSLSVLSGMIWEGP